MPSPLPSTPGCANDIDISVHRGKEDLLALVPAWLTLLGAKGEFAFYHHPAWFLALNDTLCEGTLNCVLIQREGSVLAILPFCERDNSRVISSPSHDHISLGDWILRSPDILDIILGCLSQITHIINRSKWTKMALERVLGSSNVVKRVTQGNSRTELALENQTWSFRSREVRRSFWFDCTLPDGVTLSQRDLPLSSRLKRNLRTRRKKLSKLGEVSFEQCSDNTTRQQSLDEFLRIEATGWKGENGKGTAIANHKDLTEFYQSLMRIELPGWSPSVNQLKVGDQAIAAQFEIKTNSIVSLVKIAFDEHYSEFSPGSLALEDRLMSSLNNPDIDQLSLVTCPEWAKRWHPNETPVYNLNFYNSGVRGMVNAVVDDTIYKIRSNQQQSRGQ